MLFTGNLIKHPCFNEMRHEGQGYRVANDLTNTEIIMNRIFWIGVYPRLSESAIRYMVDCIKKYVGRVSI